MRVQTICATAALWSVLDAAVKSALSSTVAMPPVTVPVTPGWFKGPTALPGSGGAQRAGDWSWSSTTAYEPLPACHTRSAVIPIPVPRSRRPQRGHQATGIDYLGLIARRHEAERGRPISYSQLALPDDLLPKPTADPGADETGVPSEVAP